MLMDIIGVIIAFSVVMLLLSLMVTSLNQATQATLRLRAKNLRYGVAAALNSETLLPDKSSLSVATAILNSTDDAALRKPAKSTSITAKLLGPRVTWLDPEEMHRILSSEEKSTEKTLSSTTAPLAAVECFKKLEKPLRNRFENIMRGVTLFWALVVAGVFQISAPALIKQLSVDPNLRAQYIEAAPALLELAVDQIETTTSYDNIYENAIAQLAETHPALRPLLARLSTEVEYPEEIAEQLRELIGDENDRYDIVSEFEGYLTAGLKKQRAQALSNARDAADQLSLIDITPLKYGMSFYTDKRVMAKNILGVLMTTILLMLGAPFWFETLKQAAAWRDLFSRR